jgi:hypothetical protein
MLLLNVSFVTGGPVSWLVWSNPVAIWWSFLVAVSALNIAVWLLLYGYFRNANRQSGMLRVELMVVLCAAYVFGCAFRSILPRADVQRICLFDMWLSSVFVGRSVATVAEICFAAQWAITLRLFAKFTKSDSVLNISSTVVPLIVLAECFSWYAVITTDYLGHIIENSIWAVTFLLIAGALLRLLEEFHSAARVAIAVAFAGVIAYVAFLALIDVPMYFDRWQADRESGKKILSLLAGLYDVSTHWVVTHDIVQWKDEIAWMSLYFSAAVWSSLALCGIGLRADRLHQYRANSTHAGIQNGARSRTPLELG